MAMIRTVVNRSEGEYDDGYAAKLVKYIPGEVLAGFIPLSAAAAQIEGGAVSTDTYVWSSLGVGALAVLGYNAYRASTLREQVSATAETELRKRLTSDHPDWSDKAIDAEVVKRASELQKDIERELEKSRPRPYFYVLALVAFAAWAFATSVPVRDLIGLTANEAAYLVALVAFSFPVVDFFLKALSEWWDSKEVTVAGHYFHRAHVH